MVIQIFDEQQKRQIARDVLYSLPDWFGLPESTKRYIEDSAKMPFWAWCEEAAETGKNSLNVSGIIPAVGKREGFIALKETSRYTAEIYVMGVLPERHHGGIGRALYEEFERYARAQGYSFLQVKTVQSGHYEEYDRTNAFYQAMGFRELECLPTLWDEWNPCQIYVKYICGK